MNALAETVSATVNYRIAAPDSLDIVKNKITHLLEPIGRKHKIKVEGFGSDGSSEDKSKASDKTSFGTLYLNNLNDFSPSPISPTDIQNPVWRILSGTIGQVFEDTKTLEGKNVVLVGDIMQGNTDTI